MCPLSSFTFFGIKDGKYGVHLFSVSNSLGSKMGSMEYLFTVVTSLGSYRGYSYFPIDFGGGAN
jgi:hypothetical protein